MTTPITQEELGKLHYFLRGDKQAVLLCLDMLYVGHLWDDLIDGDVERSSEEITEAFLKALRDIPLNPFYKKWEPYLQPMLVSVAQQYADSTKLEMGNPDERLNAFIIRNGMLAFIHHCIYIIGVAADEPGWINEVAVDFWRSFGLRDKLEEFITREGPEPEIEV